MSNVIIKNSEDIAAMRKVGKLAAEVLDYIAPFVKIGISTLALDDLCHKYITEIQHAYPAPLYYKPTPDSPPYPNAICTSINDEICHSIPNSRCLKNGDIINIDITVLKDGYHGDTSRTFCVGNKVSAQAQRLVKVTYECLWYGIAQVKPGNYLGDIGFAIQTYAHKNFYSVVEEFCGHGIGKLFHEPLQILHYGAPKTGEKMVPGMIFTIEPMINQGSRYLKVLRDGWTVVTKDRMLSAQFEHTILVTDTGYEVLTISANSPAAPPFIMQNTSSIS